MKIFLAILFSLSCAYAARGKSQEVVNLCKCASRALEEMQNVLGQYNARLTSADPPNIDEVIDKITDIAYNCTSQPHCRCPDGYFKTSDGNHCLRISDKLADCDEAAKACKNDDVNARLAVAKDHVRLTNLADELRHIVEEESEEFYWIGLSYNRTSSGGIPLWTWEDGDAASYNITSNLKIPVKKSLIRIDVNGERQAIERVAISKNYRGQHWKQEKCGRVGRNGLVKRHKFVCEYVMFKIQIKAVTSRSSPEPQPENYIRGIPHISHS